MSEIKAGQLTQPASGKPQHGVITTEIHTQLFYLVHKVVKCTQLQSLCVQVQPIPEGERAS